MVRNVFCEGRDAESSGGLRRCLKEKKRRDFALLLLHSSIFNRPAGRYSKLYDLRQCVFCLCTSPPPNPSPLVFRFRKGRRDFKLCVRVRIREVKFYTTQTL
jgi:hypothetical protein